MIALSCFASIAALSTPAGGQQFVHQPNMLPGPEIWSESIIPLDVNGDGQLDLFITNAQGYGTPGDFGAPSSDPYRPTLLIHTGTTAGVPSFQDRTEALIPPSIVIHGKSAAICDVDGDGLEDIVIAVAFGDQQRLLRKDPNGPGYLDESTRLPDLVLNAFHVGWGDLDDDGDVDLVFADAGPNSFSFPGGLARLMINDGTGHFTEAPAQLPAIPKVGAQNAKIVDIDGDLDLDIVVDGKSARAHAYLNDGNAHFSLDETLIPAGVSVAGAGAYETEWGDLDGDMDLDCVYMNFAGSGFPSTDVVLRNQLAESGQLSFTTVSSALQGENNQDENDFALFDSDNDGDLDLLVAALTFGSPVTPEKLFLNSGVIGPGFLAQEAGAFPSILDASLDLAVADFNADGRYDVVTANGEIPNSSYENLYYANVGPQDTLPPAILRVTELPRSLAIEELGEPVVLRGWIQDAIVDDGYTFVEAQLNWTVSKDGALQVGTAPMPHIGGYMHRGLVEPQPTSMGLVGASVVATISAQDPQSNSVISAPLGFFVCGSELYGPSSILQLDPPPAASPGEAVEYHVSGGEPNRPGVLAVGQHAVSIPLGPGTLLVEPQSTTRIPFSLDSNGEAIIRVPNPGSASSGERHFVQALARSSAHPSGLLLSNGVESVLCD